MRQRGIPKNIWQHSPEYNIPSISPVLRAPFSVPGFLFLYTAHSVPLFVFVSKNANPELLLIGTTKTVIMMSLDLKFKPFVL